MTSDEDDAREAERHGAGGGNVYRTPARLSEPEAPRAPSFQRLLSPLAWGSAFVIVVLAPFVALAMFDPSRASAGATRFVPLVDTMRDVSMVVMLAALLVTIAVVVRRVAPQWSGLGHATQIGYVLLVLLGQSAIIAGGEVGMVMAGGGLHLFEPVFEASVPGPSGRTAHVYTKGGLLSSCGHQVYIQEPRSLTMTKACVLTRPCGDAVPAIRWNDDGSITLTDANGEKLPATPEKTFSFASGC